jgi:hypothetical protein
MKGLEFIKMGQVADGSLLSLMAIDVTINSEAKLCILHDRPFPAALERIEFDHKTGDLHFVGRDGSDRNLGMPVPGSCRERMCRAHCAHMLLITDRTSADFKIVPVVHRKQEAA